jgi:phosphoribosylcarboxyaminoimidazole (NCAIR) mutase
VSEPQVETQTEAQFEGMEVSAPRVGIVMGSKSDMPAMDAAAQELKKRDIAHEVRVMSAHRDPTSSPTTPRTRRCAGCA